MLKFIFQKIMILSILLLFLITIGGCNKKQTEYLTDPIAIVYKNNIPYIINSNDELFDLSKYDSIVPYFGDILIVKKNNHFGYIKNTGEEITEFIYDEAYPFSENKAVVAIENKFYIINENGNTLYTFDDNISSQSYFSNNYLVVHRDNYQGYLKYDENNNHFSLLIDEPIDENTSILDSNFQYDYCGNFLNGYAVVGKINENGELKYTHINEDGKRLYDLEWDFANNFYDGYAVVGNYTDYEVKVYCSNVNRIDEEASTTITTMGYMYVSPSGQYLGTKSMQDDGSESIVPHIYALANDYSDSVALVANLLFWVDTYHSYHTYDFSTNKFFYNYDFLNVEGTPLFGKPLNAQNNWGGNSSIYNSIFQLDNYYITTFYRSSWYVKYTPIEELNWSEPFLEIKYDLKENTNNDYLLEHYPWIDTYLKNFTSGNQEPLYVVDTVVSPYYLTDFKKSKYLDNQFVARAHTYSGMGDSCGLIAISTTNDTLQLSYIIAPLYENIIF
jgi:KWG